MLQLSAFRHTHSAFTVITENQCDKTVHDNKVEQFLILFKAQVSLIYRNSWCIVLYRYLRLIGKLGIYHHILKSNFIVKSSISLHSQVECFKSVGFGQKCACAPVTTPNSDVMMY